MNAVDPLAAGGEGHEPQLLLQEGGTGAWVPDVVVAADGTGNFSRVQDAVDSVPPKSQSRYVIHIKKGLYREYVQIPADRWNVVLLGDGIDQTIISGSRNAQDGWKTHESATVSKFEALELSLPALE